MIRRGFVVTEADIHAPPASGHSGYQVAADALVKLQDQVFAEGTVGESAVRDVGFEGQNAEGDAGRQVDIALNAERRFYETDGRVRRLSSASTIFWSTGFPSNAMLRATFAAFQCLTRYQPVGGPGDKVFPPTYEGREIRGGKADSRWRSECWSWVPPQVWE